MQKTQTLGFQQSS